MNTEKNQQDEQYKKRTKSGLALLVIGSALLLTGFIITCVNFHSDQSFTIIMYGTSSVGIVLLFWGLYLIVG